MLERDAECLARQRGPEYGFGPASNIDHPQNVLNQLPPDKEHLLDTVPADNLESEHYFGDFTQRLSKCGSKYTEHVSECLTIAGSTDLAFSSHEWKSKSFKVKYDKMMDQREAFALQQRQLREAMDDTTEERRDYLEHGRRKAGMVEKLKEHKGPITNISDVEDILSQFHGWHNNKLTASQEKKLKSIFRQEITYARDYVFDNIKKTGNPLFKINKLSVREMAENLKVLYGGRSDHLLADIEDVRAALRVISKEDDEDPKEDAASEHDITIEDDYMKDDAIVFKTEGTLVMGIIEDVHPDEVWTIPLESFKQSESIDDSVAQFWRYPVELDLITVMKSDILPCHPILELDCLNEFSERLLPVDSFQTVE